MTPVSSEIYLEIIWIGLILMQNFVDSWNKFIKSLTIAFITSRQMKIKHAEL